MKLKKDRKEKKSKILDGAYNYSQIKKSSLWLKCISYV